MQPLVEQRHRHSAPGVHSFSSVFEDVGEALVSVAIGCDCCFIGDAEPVTLAVSASDSL